MSYSFTAAGYTFVDTAFAGLGHTTVVSLPGTGSSYPMFQAIHVAALYDAANHVTNANNASTLASQWATQTSGLVATTDYSAKAWSIGGTGVTGGAGAAKEWAALSGAYVTGTSLSAYEWAVGTWKRGSANYGSAKDWATYMGGTVDGTGYSAQYWATQSASSAAALNALSTTSATLGTGTISLTLTASGKQFAAGMPFYAYSQSNPAKFVTGTVTSYSGTAFAGTVTAYGGAGSVNDWYITVSGIPGAAGASGSHWYGAAGGTADAITATITGPTTTDGTTVVIMSAGANTSSAPTFNLNAAGAYTITTRGGKMLIPGETGPAGYEATYTFRASTSNWELQNPYPVGKTYVGGTAGGTANALTCTTGAGLTTLTKGDRIFVKIGASANSGAATLAPDSVSATAIQKNGSALVGGELLAGTNAALVFDGTNLQIDGGTGYGAGLFTGVLAKSGNYTVVAADVGKLVTVSAAATITLTAAGTLGNGACGGVVNLSTGTVVVSPASGTINTVASLSLPSGASLLWVSDGSNFSAAFSSGPSLLSAWAFDAGYKGANITLSNSNKTATGSASGSSNWLVLGNTAISGMKYFEFTVNAGTTSSYLAVGAATRSASLTTSMNGQTPTYGFDSSGRKVNNAATAYGSTWTTGYVIGVAVDTSVNNIWVSVNGVWQGSGNPTSGTNPMYTMAAGTYYPCVEIDDHSPNYQLTINYSLTYAPPLGFTAL